MAVIRRGKRRGRKVKRRKVRERKRTLSLPCNPKDRATTLHASPLVLPWASRPLASRHCPGPAAPVEPYGRSWQPVDLLPPQSSRCFDLAVISAPHQRLILDGRGTEQIDLGSKRMIVPT